MSAMSSELLPAPRQHRGDFRERVTVLSHAVHSTPAEAGATIVFPLFTEDAEPQRGQVTIPRPHSWLAVMLLFQVRWIRGQSPSSRGRLPTPPVQDAPGGQRILPAAVTVARTEWASLKEGREEGRKDRWIEETLQGPLSSSSPLHPLRTLPRLCARPVHLSVRRGDLCRGSASACMYHPPSHAPLPPPSVQSQEVPPDHPPSCPGTINFSMDDQTQIEWKGYRTADPKTVTKAPGTTSGGRPGQAVDTTVLALRVLGKFSPMYVPEGQRGRNPPHGKLAQCKKNRSHVEPYPKEGCRRQRTSPQRTV
ncbi:uncharacterized protein LOC111556252 [Felis catus]|uniref:uncharacterized protein LOC111556252 n=1 Tax=Felis catus TaxID=9685 RepID=UPI001D199889|nr:uncharacterized protein LOC111556252 [Felis catus]